MTSTTIKLKDSKIGKGNDSEVLIIRHTPGSLLNSSNATNGKYSIDLNISTRQEITLNENIPSGILNVSHLELDGDSSKATEVLDVDLVASISEGVGNITGTLTLGKASLRSGEIKIRAGEIFLTEKE